MKKLQELQQDYIRAEKASLAAKLAYIKADMKYMPIIRAFNQQWGGCYDATNPGLNASVATMRKAKGEHDEAHANLIYLDDLRCEALARLARIDEWAQIQVQYEINSGIYQSLPNKNVDGSLVTEPCRANCDSCLANCRYNLSLGIDPTA